MIQTVRSTSTKRSALLGCCFNIWIVIILVNSVVLNSVGAALASQTLTGQIAIMTARWIETSTSPWSSGNSKLLMLIMTARSAPANSNQGRDGRFADCYERRLGLNVRHFRFWPQADLTKQLNQRSFRLPTVVQNGIRLNESGSGQLNRHDSALPASPELSRT